jgi:V/A-type H+/Na+-transporting ATPase subunit D
MARRQPKTRLELKRQREALARFEHFLGALQKKQQKLQIAVEELKPIRAGLADRVAVLQAGSTVYESLLGDPAGLDVRALARPREVRTSDANVAGVAVPVFEAVVFDTPEYSLFATPVWVDRALIDLRELAGKEAELTVLDRRHQLLSRELLRIIQRVNLFEKVMIPGAEAAIRRIRIHLGDEMVAAVGRAKLAKGKLAGSTARAGVGSEP